MVGFHLLEGAGHWVQQEQPEQVSALLIQFLRDQKPRSTKGVGFEGSGLRAQGSGSSAFRRKESYRH